MPLHLPAFNRREFLVRSSAASATALLFGTARADNPRVDPDLFAMLNDSHVSERTELAPNGRNISENLRHVVRYLIDLPRRPAAVFINGDLAHNKGLPGDYRQLATLIQPLSEAGIALHLTMGNHDDRATFYDVLREHQPMHPVVATRHAAMVAGARANFFLLDSLTQTNVVTGELGAEQLDWLTTALDAHRDRPALIVVHHNPQFQANGPESKFVWSGLRDAPALFDALAQRPQVKAYVHGHEHNWGLSRRGEIHVVNTPAVGYVAKDGLATTGWTMIRLCADGATFTTRTINGAHPWHDRSHELVWRDA